MFFDVGYVSPVGDVIDGDLSPVETDKWRQSTKDVSRCFLENDLLLNPTKIRAIVFGTRQRLQAINSSRGILAADASVRFADTVKLLGVTLDATLSFDRHVTDVVRGCNYHIRAFRSERG